MCILGEIGSGKSNMLEAVNGEMMFVPKELHNREAKNKEPIKESEEKKPRKSKLEDADDEETRNFKKEVMLSEIKDSPIKLQGSVSYVSSDIWLPTQETIRDTICFGEDYEEEWYNKVIQATQLKHDTDKFE